MKDTMKIDRARRGVALRSGLALALLLAACGGPESGPPGSAPPSMSTSGSASSTATTTTATNASSSASGGTSADVAPPGTGVAFAQLPLEQALERSRTARGLVMVNVQAEWCGWCRKLEKEVYSSPRVAEATRDLVVINVDGEKGEGPKIAARYGVRGFPTVLFLDSHGEALLKVEGYLPLDDFLRALASLPRSRA